MKNIIQEAENGIDTLRQYLKDIRGAKLPKSTNSIVTYLNEPWAKALGKLPGKYSMILANVEILLAQANKSEDLDATVDAFANSMEGERNQGYWSIGAISQGVADTSVKVGILKPSEKKWLLEKRVWDSSPFEISKCVKDLEESIKFLSKILDKVRVYL
jgi:hypothetical protein